MKGAEIQRFKVWMTAISIVNGVISLILKWIISIVIVKVLEEASGIAINSESRLYNVILLKNVEFIAVAISAVVLCLLQAFLNALMMTAGKVYGRAFANQLREEVLESLSSTSSFGDSLSVASDIVLKIQKVEDYIVNCHCKVLQRTTIAVCSFALVFTFTWIGGLIAIGFFLSGSLSKHLLFRKSIAFTQNAIDTTREKLNAELLDVVKNSTRVKMIKTAKLEHDRFNSIHSEVQKEWKMNLTYTFIRFFLYNSIIINVPFVIAISAFQIIRNASSLEEKLDIGFGILCAIFLLDETHKALLLLTDNSEKKEEVENSLSAIEVFKAAGNEESDATSLGNVSDNDDEDIESKILSNDQVVDVVGLKDVTFRFPSSPVSAGAIFNRFSREFSIGKIHGLMGERGSGKSTLLKLLAGLIHPDSGKIILGNKNNLKIAYVTQDQHLFARTIRENITYGGSKELLNDDKQIWNALRKARIDPWVQKLPDGLDTILKDGENEVSGGQLQRLALAHLFLTGRDAELVLLDEVLSAVDQQSREILIDELANFLKKKTSIIITHHTEMLRICGNVQDMPKDHALTKRGGSMTLSQIALELSQEQEDSVGHQSLRKSAISGRSSVMLSFKGGMATSFRKSMI